MNILISGMGIAGPTLAYWLRRAGHVPVVVEQAPELRRGGYIIDFWGLGYDVADKMGLLSALKERAYFIEQVEIVDRKGHRVGGFSADVFKRATSDRYMSLPRGDLSAALYSTIPDVEVLWGNSIAAIEQGDSEVSVAFESSQPRSFDLVVGADGLHSVVRQLCFEGESRAETYLGYHVAAFEVDGYPHRNENTYVGFNAPGRQIARFSMRKDRTLFLLTFRQPTMVNASLAADSVRSLLRDRFGGLGWETAEILAVMDRANDIYFDRVSQIEIPHWSSGRAALIGDAAACPSLLAGEGSALAMAAAYILAGELSQTPSDWRSALIRYEHRLKPFVGAKQQSARRFAASFVPKSRLGIALRNLVTKAFVVPAIADAFLGSTLKGDFALPAFSWRT